MALILTKNQFINLWIFEFRLKNETVNMTIWNFLLPFFRLKERGLNFDQCKFFCEGTPSQYKKLIEPPNNRAGYIVQWLNYVEDTFILDKEKSIKILLWSNKEAKPIAGIAGIAGIYDCTSLVKPSFISKLNKLLPIYCSLSNFFFQKKNTVKLFRQQIRKDFLSKTWQKKVSYQSK